MENLYPLPRPPPIKDAEMERFGFWADSSLILGGGGDGGLLFLFILSKIAAKTTFFITSACILEVHVCFVSYLIGWLITRVFIQCWATKTSFEYSYEV